MSKPPPIRISEAFDDPVPLPDAVTMVDLIDKAKHCTSFTRYDYQWLQILLEEIWFSQEFRLRMRLLALENELRSRREQTKKAEADPPCSSGVLNS